MKLGALLGLFGLAASTGVSAARIPRDYNAHDYYVLHLDRSASPDDIAARLGLRHEGELGELDDHHVFRAPKADVDIVKRELFEQRKRKRSVHVPDALDGVLLAAKQKPRQHLQKRMIPPPPPGYVYPRSVGEKPQAWAVTKQKDLMTSLEISDPIFQDQWHLYNTVQTGHDVNVTGLWLEGITGHNVTVALIDDGLDMHSNDLKVNYYAEGSYDFNDHDEEPAPELSDDHHGTRCAGEVAAARNDVCGVGVAYDSKIAGIRILSAPISDADEAEAMIYKPQHNQIYSCSWGPPDDGRSMEAPDVLIRRAMLKGIQDGRGGLGSIYVFASGNGALNDDNCNFDGYTNSIYSITIGAVDRAGLHPYYSEHCSAQLVVTYSSGSGDAIHTTDVGADKCYSGHGGTSAAAPLAAGIFALVLQVRPDLTWRDLQYLAMITAAPVTDPKEDDWTQTAAGRKFSHTFGYGKIDSYSLVEKAKTWEKVKPQAWYFSPWVHVKKDIPEGKDGIAVSVEITEDMLKEANLERVEHVTVTMNVDHTRRGDLNADLVSPEGYVSHIATARKDDEFQGGYDDWTFMSVAHWGESGVGKWTVIVRDTVKNEHHGKFIDWRIKLWGESIDADKATLLPMPDEHDDDDHDVIAPPVSTVSEGDHPTKTKDLGNPTDHPDRPTKIKTTDAPEITGPPLSEITNAEGVEDAVENGKQGGGNMGAQETTPTPSSSSWINWFPSFGKSKTAKIWVFGALGLIVAFCAGLGIYLFVARRRRLRNSSRNNYEFELLDEEETEALNNGEKGAGARRGTRKRGGELYDAFAEGSDDEEEMFGGYRDQGEASSSSGPSSDHGALTRHAEKPGGDEEEQYVVGEESDDDDYNEKSQRTPLSRS